MIPAENEKDLTEIPDNVKQGLTIIPVSNVREVLAQALVRAPEPVEWDEAVEEAAAARQVKAETPAAPVAH
jgi:ATP-dependent Lon protease